MRLPDDDDALIRASDLLGDRARGIPPILPMSRTTLFVRVRAGDFPLPVRLGARAVAWRAGDIRAWLAGLAPARAPAPTPPPA